MFLRMDTAGAIGVMMTLAVSLPPSSAATTATRSAPTTASPSTRTSAWNGHVDPGSTSPAPFTPYWITPGSLSFDDSDERVRYLGRWSTDKHRVPHNRDFIGDTVHYTTQIGAEVAIRFNGTGIEWFGNTGKDYGSAHVYLDGTLASTVKTHEKTWRDHQRIWYQHHLSLGEHTLRIVNIDSRQKSQRRLVIDAFIVTGAEAYAEMYAQNTSLTSEAHGIDFLHRRSIVSGRLTESSDWLLERGGETGVSAMQLAVLSDAHALIVDKVEHNLLTIDGHPAWAAIYDFSVNKATPIRVSSNSFCAGGSFLSNGTMINVGGNPVVEDRTNSADFGDLNGLQGIRLLRDCDDPKRPSRCFLYENHARVRLAVPRWYATVVRIADGSAMIIGGSKAGGWINNSTTNNPTIEYFPPKGSGLPIHSQFLVDTLNANLFPIAFALPGGKVFIAANQDAMIYDWKANSELRLPKIPNGVRVTYPMAGTGVLLPLDPENGYTPEVLLCGGSAIDDRKPSWEISSQDPASKQCSRIVLTDTGIQHGWSVEDMPQARLMPDAVLLPTGDVFIVNGAQSGISGYGNVRDQKGASNADNPVFRPVIYSPASPPGQRFTDAGLPSSNIPRLYHSVATLLPDGRLLVAGSNPNLDRSDQVYRTEYAVEHFVPSYVRSEARPRILRAPRMLRFGKSYTITVEIPDIRSARELPVKVSLMDLGFVTHAVHANSRLVFLKTTVSADKRTITIHAPPSGDIYPPGPGWLFLVVNNLPSVGKRVIVGDGSGPPVDLSAISKLLKNTRT